MTSAVKNYAACAAIGLMASLGTAQAATITATGTSLSIECSASACQGFVGGSLTVGNPGNRVQAGTMAGLSVDGADIYQIGQNSEANEEQALDFLLDGLDNDAAPAGVQTNTMGVDMLTFTTSAQFLAIKIGQGHLFLALSGNGPVTITFDGVGVQGGGLSHYTEFGQLAAVPLPAAGLMLITGVGGLAALRRRRKAS